MASIAKEVWKAIESDVIIRRAIGKNIVSMKNLAVHLIEKHHIQAAPDAIISAIRRYRDENPLEKKIATAKRIAGQSEEIRITSNIVGIDIEKSSETQDLLPRAFHQVNYGKGEILIVIQGESTIKLMLNEKNKHKVLECFPKKSVLAIKEHLAEVNIKLKQEAANTPGILSLLSTELMTHDINVSEVVSCLPEMLFFVEQKDVVKSYEVLFNLCQARPQ